MSFLPDIYMPSDLAALQQRLLAAAQGTDTSVRSCAALDQGTRAAWGAFYIQVVDYANNRSGDPTAAPSGPPLIFFGSKVDLGQKLERDLAAWQTKIAAVCALALPVFNPAPVTQPNDWTQLARYGVLFVGIVGGAYAVGKIAELAEIIPHARGAKTT